MQEDKYNNQSFGRLYSENYNRAVSFVRSYVYDLAIAQDIAADSLIKLWEQMKEGLVEQPVALLMTILKHKSLDHLKHIQIKDSTFQQMTERYQRELTSRIGTLEAVNPDDIFSNEIEEILKQTLSRLPETTRMVFLKSRFEYQTVKEIAQELGLSEKAVEYHITRSLKILRIALKDYLPLVSFFVTI